MFGHPANGIAMRAAAEAMIKSLFIIDGEAGRFFMMEGAAGLIFTARARHLDRAPDQGRQGDTGPEFVQPLGG
jgi:hypothetical protein